MKAVRIFQFPKIILEFFQIVSQIVNFCSIKNQSGIGLTAGSFEIEPSVLDLHHKYTCNGGHLIWPCDKYHQLFSFDEYLFHVQYSMKIMKTAKKVLGQECFGTNNSVPEYIRVLYDE